MCECGRRAGATAFCELHSQLPEVQILLGGAKEELDSGSTAVGNSWLLPYAPLDLETASGPQQGTGMWVQKPFCFGGR